ncbi:MAG: NAD(P)H-binding protein [Gammaproteobacteria bacterium]|nr:NAD(P)H-binding protein [Gammaproteobacteria bacterium]
MPYRNTGPLLVTGAAGQLGRRVLHHLLATEGVPAKDVIAVTRKPEALADLASQGVVVRQGSFDDPAGLARAFAGAKRALIISTDKIDVPGAREIQHANAVNAAKAAGVKHIVYTSMYGCDPGSPVTALAPSHYATEQALAKSGLTWTVLRHTWYMDGLPGTLAQSYQFGGQFVTAGNDEPVNYVAREDCARADAAALAADSAASVRLDVTGPTTVTASQLAALATELTGKPLKVVLVSPEDRTNALTGAGLPPPIAALIVSIDVNTRSGATRNVSDAVQKLTGRAPQSVREFLAANKAALTA